MATFKVPIVGEIRGDEGEDPIVRFAPVTPKPKRKSRKDVQIERLTKDLEEAKRHLHRICETARDDTKEYPYRVGACQSIASWALKVLGDSSEDDRFMAEVHHTLETYGFSEVYDFSAENMLF